MKICCIADLHVGIKSYSQIDPETHLYSREIEILNTFRYIVQQCIEQHIPILIIAGDVFHTSKPNPNLQDEVNKILYFASSHNLYILILDGNHDKPKLNNSVSVLKSTDTFHIPNIIHTSQFLDKEININNDICRFIFLPTYTDNNQIKELLDQNLYINNDYSNPIIVIGHFTTQGAQLNDWLISENEEHIDIHLFDNRNINFVVLGHLHKTQILKEKDPIIFYTGSLQRTDFNEENQEKGYYIIDSLTNDYIFYPIITQKFYTINIKINNDLSVLEQIYSSINQEKIKDAIVRVIIEVNEDLQLSIEEENQLKDYLLNLGAYNIISIKQKLITTKKTRNVDFNELLSLDKALEIFYKDQTRGNERIKLGKQIIKDYYLQK